MLLLRRAVSAAALYSRVASAAAPFRRAVSALAVAPPPPPTNFAALLAEARAAAAEARAAAAERELATVWKLVEAKEAASKDALAAADKLVAQTITAADALVASKDALVASKDALVAQTVASKDELVASKDALVAQTVASKDALMIAASTAHAVELATAKHATDVAKSRLSVRAILETSIAEAFASWAMPHDDAKTPSERLMKMLDAHKGCEGLKAYLRVAATDNGVPPEDTLKEGRKLYASFCSRAHADAPEGSEGISSVVFDGVGRTSLVAYAALVSYTGRHLRLYATDDNSAVLPLAMRELRHCTATEAQIRASPKVTG
jgi:hypothetical protein